MMNFLCFLEAYFLGFESVFKPTTAYYSAKFSVREILKFATLF